MPTRADHHSHAMKLVILGRDGTLNQYRDDHVKAPDELQPLPGALEAVARLNHAGWHTVMATNQPGIGRGLIDMATLNAVHVHLNKLLAEVGGRLDGVFFCPHTPEEGCSCRKPLPGLLQQIGARFGVALPQVHMVGASLRDLQTAAAAGCVPHLVRGDRLASTPESQIEEILSQVPGSQQHKSLADFAEYLIHSERAMRGEPEVTHLGDLN